MTPKPNHLITATLALTLPGVVVLIGLIATGRLAPGPGLLAIAIIAAGNAALLFRPLTRVRRLADRLKTLIDAPVDLGPTEFRLLRFLMEHPGRVFSREQLLDSVWGHDAYIEPRTVDVHIRRLRKAMNLPDTEDLIRTVRSAGYALDLKNEFA